MGESGLKIGNFSSTPLPPPTFFSFSFFFFYFFFVIIFFLCNIGMRVNLYEQYFLSSQFYS